VTSFFESVKHAANQDHHAKHVIMIIDDHSTADTVSYLKKLVYCYTRKNVACSFLSLAASGVMESIRATYEWLRDNGIDLVYQVQDDYLFHPKGVSEMVDISNQLWKDCNARIVVSPWNRSELWKGSYRYWASPRTVVVGKHRYWIQLYDTSCTFLTHVQLLKEQWDIIEVFLGLPPKGLSDGSLESVSLNYMFTKRGILGLMPVDSLALHIQSENDKDPHIDWKKWWDGVKLV
jgi:glycosyltransferase involved in cell wall biosynthesis